MTANGDVTIDAGCCPTCDENRYIVLRGNRVDCPTCCSTIRLGKLKIPADKPLRDGWIKVVSAAGAVVVLAGMGGTGQLPW
jgi:hypothetical protein